VYDRKGRMCIIFLLGWKEGKAWCVTWIVKRSAGREEECNMGHHCMGGRTRKVAD
jgi:hypothetical protein